MYFDHVQVVWAESTHVGLGGAVRPSDGLVIIVGRYKPTGNLPDDYQTNVKPLVEYEEEEENSDDEYEDEYGENLLYFYILMR